MPAFPQRVSHRWKGFDYGSANGYFVTLVTHHRQALFGAVENEQVKLNPFGSLVQDCWKRLPLTFPILLDEWVVMPDHFHGILFIVEEKAQASGAGGTQPASLGAIMQTFKTITTTRINRLRRSSGQAVWQRNYYDHVLRCEEDYRNVVRYVFENPLRHDLEAAYLPD